MPAPSDRVLRARFRYGAVALLSLVLAGGFYWLLRAGGLRIVPEELDVASLGTSSLVLYSLLWLLTLGFKALRWRWQLLPIARVPELRIFSASLLGFAALLLLPVRTGEAVRPWLISRNTQVPFLAAVGTSASERIVDGVFASLMLIVSLLHATLIRPLPSHIGDLPVPTAFVPTLGYLAATASLVALGLAIAFFYFRAGVQRLIRVSIGRVWEQAGLWLEQRLAELASGLRFLSNLRYAGPFLLASLVYWLLYWFGTWFLLDSAGLPGITWAQVGVVVGTLAFATSLPNAPGFFGAFQLAVYASLALFYSKEVIQDQGAIAVFWFYALQLGWVFALVPAAAIYEWRVRKTTPPKSGATLG